MIEFLNDTPDLVDDTIVAEIRASRGVYAASLANDPDRIFDDIQRRQHTHPARIVSFPARRVPPQPASANG